MWSNMSALNRLAIIAVVLVLAFAGFQSCQASRANERAARAQAEYQEAAMTALGYETAFAAVKKGLLAKDSVATELERALRASEARRIARVEVRVESRVDTVLVAVPGDDPDDESIAWDLNRDPFYGRLVYTPPRDLGVDLLCAPRMEQYIVDTPDGRLLIGVRPLSPNTEVSIDAFDATPYVQPKRGLGIRHLIGAALVGAVSWEIIR
jgi:hypothetical protein